MIAMVGGKMGGGGGGCGGRGWGILGSGSGNITGMGVIY